VSDLAAVLQQRMNTARKAQQKEVTLLLGTILAGVKNREIELKRSVTDEDVLDVIRKGVKTRRESVDQFSAANRMDLADKEAAEILLLEEFLPPAVNPAEIRAAVRAAIDAGAKDIGKVMAQVMPQFKGRAEGKQISAIAREELQAG
jgi:uncharacterized protein YqeY